MGRNCNCLPEPGDHIFCTRKGGLYDHHGIYVGDNMVIHLAGKAKKLQPPSCQECRNKGVVNGEMAKICLDCFLGGENFFIYEYGVFYSKHKRRKMGTCSFFAARPPNKVVGTATHFLEHDRFGGYNLFANNCEDFAVYCKTGLSGSHQVIGRIRRLGLIPFGIVVSLPIALGYFIAKGINDIRRSHSPS
ncbi:hypothetical protein V6N13_040599 [Hibiscus sabdariffa]|uniref:Uncharacterized protein n=2 Tax=Hibiscus sabdariffa TaxID=183260 RepID=A0ABR1ZLB1_9ROSI